jgi:uncharacterized protein involved in exopolysaccharide biosynthesis
VNEPFDAFEFFAFVRKRWRVIAVACGVAMLLAGVVSLLLPKRYTATASIIIEPPGGSDVRAATAVSPVYLESLRTYEQFAASDTLFARAVERFHLQAGPHPPSIDVLKRSILKVSKLRDTKILEISATLTDPQLAQKFVEYLATETITLSRGASLDADRELIDDASWQLSEIQERLAKARSAWTGSAVADSTAALQSSVDASSDVLAKVRRELVTDETAPEHKRRLMEHRLAELEKSMQRDSDALAFRSAHRQALEMDLNAAQAAFDAASEHLRELRANEGTRGERLRVIDPGIVPQRPSSPNLTLNVLAALLFALASSSLYLALAFAWHARTRPQTPEAVVRRVFAR